MRRLTPFIFLALAAAFLFGMARLFHLRFEAGDVYPQYSSLRADPVGTKAFYESLESLVAVQRNYRPLAKLPSYGKATVLLLGVRGDEMECDQAEFAAIQSFVRAGGRIVITLLPSYDLPRPTPGAAIARAQQAKEGPPPISLTNAWSFTIAHAPVLRDPKGVYKPASATLRPDSEGESPLQALGHSLPSNIEIHTGLFFTNLVENWRVIYERKGEHPVVIERQLGSGTINLAADSYYFSNEALLKERQPELLAWFIGPNRKVIFDETHLGVTESPGVAALVRKYRLHGFVAGLVVLAALFVWKNSSSLIPRQPQSGPAAPEVILGRESAAGFVNLMRRNIRKSDLLGVCLTEWRQSCAQRVSVVKLEEIQRVIDEDNAAERPNPVRVYREISRILNERKLRPARE